jgi:N4-gp56 family major capsid protein
MANLVQTAYDRMVEFALRSQPLFRSVADKRPAQQAMPGSSVVLELYQDMAQQTATLNEVVDPDAVAIGNPTTVPITLNEYGAAVLMTKKLNLFALSDVDPAIANIVAYNLADSVDEVVQTVLRGGTQVIRQNGDPATVAPTYNGGTTAGVTTASTFSSKAVRLAVAKLRAQKVVPRKGSLYWCGIHPEVSHDLRAEVGESGWRQPHSYSAPGNIWAGEIGGYEGAYFIETPRAFSALDGAGGTVRVFRSYFAGQQALAEALAEEFHVVIGPVVDKLMRQRPIGWYGVAGWAIYRQEALIRVETTSSIHSGV